MAVSAPIPCPPKCWDMPRCKSCNRVKAPHGRSVPMAAHGSYCDAGCAGYEREPISGHMWPGEADLTGCVAGVPAPKED